MFALLKKNYLTNAILLMILGVLFMIEQNNVINIGVICIGVILCIYGVINLFLTKWLKAIIEIVLGGLMIAFTYVFSAATIYIFAVLLIIYAIFNFAVAIEYAKIETPLMDKVLMFVSPILSAAVGVLIFVYPSSSTNAIFYVAGSFLIAESILMIIDYLVFRAKTDKFIESVIDNK